MRTNLKTPKGIKFLAVLLFLIAALIGIIAAVMVKVPTPPKIGFVLHLLQYLPPDSYGDPVFIAFLIGTGIYCIVLGFGLCLLKSWARWAMLFTTIIPLGRGAIAACQIIAFYRQEFWQLFGTAFWVCMSAYAAIAYYLIQPEVQKAFSQDDWELHSEDSNHGYTSHF